jgi:hypothetical protein
MHRHGLFERQGSRGPKSPRGIATPGFHAIVPSARANGRLRTAPPARTVDAPERLWRPGLAGRFSIIRAHSRPSLRRSRSASLGSQPSSAAGLDRVNCGPQVLIAAITVTAIRDVVATRNADHA